MTTGPRTWRSSVRGAAPGGVGALVLVHRRRLLVAAACSAATPVVELAAPWPLAYAVDHVLDPGGSSALGVLLAGCAAGMLVLAGVGAAVDYLSLLRTEQACELVGADLRRAVFGRAVRLSLRYHHRTRSGELVSRLTSDVGRVLDAVGAATFVLVADGLLVLGAVGVLAALDLWLAVTALAVVPPLAFVAHRQRGRVRAAQSDAREHAGALAALATDLLRNVAAVQAFGRRAVAERRFAAGNDALRDARLRAVRVSARWTPSAELVLAAGSAVALVVAVLRVRSGAISVGALVLAMAYVRNLYGPVRSLAKLSGAFAKAEASAARLRDVLDCADLLPDRPDAPPAPPVRHGVRLVGVRLDLADLVGRALGPGRGQAGPTAPGRPPPGPAGPGPRGGVPRHLPAPAPAPALPRRGRRRPPAPGRRVPRRPPARRAGRRAGAAGGGGGRRAGRAARRGAALAAPPRRGAPGRQAGQHRDP